MTKRLEWVDIFKGIMIILVVLGHSNNALTYKWIYSFHMAAFFYISGYCTNFEKDNFIDFFKKKFKSLIIPYILINIAFYVLQLVLYKIGMYNYFYTDTFMFNSILNFIKYSWTFDLAAATWFLFVLFFALINIKLMIDILKDKKKDKYTINLIFTTILFCLFYIMFWRHSEKLNYFIDLIPFGMFFIVLGNYYNKIKDKFNKNYLTIVKIITIILWAYLVGYHFQSFDVAYRLIANPIKTIIYAFGGIFVVEYISMLLTKFKYIKNILMYTGKKSLDVMMYHFLSFRIIFVILYLLKKVNIEQVQSLVPKYTSCIYTLLTAFLAVGISLLIAYVVEIIKKQFIKC